MQGFTQTRVTGVDNEMLRADAAEVSHVKTANLVLAVKFLKYELQKDTDANNHGSE